MNHELIHNTTVQIPDREVKPGEVISNVQICPIGDFPNGDHQQHCTAEALQNVVKDWTERGSKEILVDFEHNSESKDPNSDTSAAAWVSNVRVDPDRGLVGDFSRITDVYSTYDSIERGSPEHNSGQPTIRYKKKFDDGTLVCLEVIATKHKKLRFKDAWKEVPST